MEALSVFTLASFHKMNFTIRNTGEASCVFLSVQRCVIGNFYASLDNLDGTSIRRRFHVQSLRYHTFSFLPTCNTCNISSTQQGSTCIVLFDQMSNHFNHDGHSFLEFSVTRSSWLNCALRDDEAVYWVSIGLGHYEAVAVGN